MCHQEIYAGSWDLRTLTCIDEELVWNTRVVHIMDGCRKNGCQDLKIGEDSLFRTDWKWWDTWSLLRKKNIKIVPKEKAFLHLVQVWTAECELTGPHQQREGCYDRPHLGGSDPQGSSCTSQMYLLGSWTSWASLVPVTERSNIITILDIITFLLQKVGSHRLEEELTWKMAYIMQVRGRLFEYSETVKMFRPHLFRSSNSWKGKRQGHEINRIFFLQSNPLKSKN